MKRLYLFAFLFLLSVLPLHAVAVDKCSSLESGSYELEGDILATSSPCLKISSNTVLEGNGYALNATKEYSALGLAVEGDNVVVRNLTLVNFEEGITLKGRNITLENIRVLGPSTMGEVGIFVGSTSTTLYNIQVLNYEVHIAFAYNDDTNLTKAVLSDYASLGLIPPTSPPSLYAPAPLPDSDEDLERFEVSYEIEDGVLRVEVLDEDGEPVDDALVLLAKFYTESKYIIVDSATTADGIVEIPIPSAGEYYFKVKKRGFYVYESERFYVSEEDLAPSLTPTLPSAPSEGSEDSSAEDGSGSSASPTTLSLFPISSAEEGTAVEGAEGEDGNGDSTPSTAEGEGESVAALANASQEEADVMGLYEATVEAPSASATSSSSQEGWCRDWSCYILLLLALFTLLSILYIVGKDRRRRKNPFRRARR